MSASDAGDVASGEDEDFTVDFDLGNAAVERDDAAKGGSGTETNGDGGTDGKGAAGGHLASPVFE